MNSSMRSTGLASFVAALALGGCSVASAPDTAPALRAQPGLPAGMLRGAPARHFESFFACPAHGPLKYVSDYNNNVIDVYAGKFAGQAPCGVLSSKLNNPWGLYVKPDTHDLYVANDGAKDILVFHRGDTKPYDTYTDPTVQDPVDVAVAPDGTVIASNLIEANQAEGGSLSTWISGPNGGTFVGNFAMAGGGLGQFVTIRGDGTVYFDKLNGQTNIGSLWFVTCPAGACGDQTEVRHVTFSGPGGLAFDSGGDLRANEGGPALADSFELPHTHPRTFSVLGYPTGLAINEAQHHWFIADGLNNQAEEYAYPSGTLIGIVAGNPGGGTFGIAVDPGATP